MNTKKNIMRLAAAAAALLLSLGATAQSLIPESSASTRGRSASVGIDVVGMNTRITNAQNQANYAVSVATGAQNTANAAYNYADAAYGTANWAVAIGQNATNLANNAQGQANWALDRARYDYQFAKAVWTNTCMVSGQPAWVCEAFISSAWPAF